MFSFTRNRKKEEKLLENSPVCVFFLSVSNLERERKEKKPRSQPSAHIKRRKWEKQNLKHKHLSLTCNPQQTSFFNLHFLLCALKVKQANFRFLLLLLLDFWHFTFLHHKPAIFYHMFHYIFLPPFYSFLFVDFLLKFSCYSQHKQTIFS